MPFSRLRRSGGEAAWRAPALLVALAVFLLSLAIVGTWYLRVYFGRVSLDQLLFHLDQGGLEWVDPKALWRGLRTLMVWVLLTGSLLLLHRQLRNAWRWGFWLGLLGAAGLSLGSTFDDPCELPEGEDVIARHYADPRAQAVAAAQQRPDLLLVYVESLDAAYAGTRAFGQPLVPQLASWRQEHTRLGLLQMLDGASWTMAGIFSSLCGLPLQAVGLSTPRSSGQSKHFFDKGQCLTDWLSTQGWELSFYGGASLSFAGKGRFLAEHGVSRRFGRDEWQALGLPVPAEGWGLADTALVDAVLKDWQRPRPAEQARASLVLTVNSHDPHGNPDPACADAGKDSDGGDQRLRAALACSDAAVLRLVQQFVDQNDGRAKLVWIMGDHLSKGHPLMDALQKAAQQRNRPRAIFHALGRWDAQGRELPLPSTQRLFTHLDVAPTLAELLGLRWSPQNGRLGLGVSLVAPEAQRTLLERSDLRRLNAELACPSPLFARLWS